MAGPAYDVAGIGNAIVDVLAQGDGDLLARLRLEPNVMTLVDAARSEEIYGAMGPAVEVSGGSAANTMAGVAALGGRAAYIGKVRNDQMGAVFRHDLRAQGVTFDTPAATSGPPTARCLVLVSEDGHRTMQTYLGACVELAPDDIDPAVAGGASVVYFEGYLWDEPQAKRALLKAAGIAHEAGHRVAMTLSDPFCVERHRDEFLGLLGKQVDIVFANEAEITSLYRCDFPSAIRTVRDHCSLAALTRGERGSVIVSGEHVVTVAAEPVAKVVDTTGAGDLYAAGFLHGLTQGRELHVCGRLGSICAAEIISHLGARPEANLAHLAASALAG